MAGDHETLRARLAADDGDPFDLLADIAAYATSHGVNADSTDLVIRALEKPERFAHVRDMLHALTLQHGLYPYSAQQGGEDSLRDAVVMEMNRPDPDETKVFHRVQSQVFHRLMGGENVILSAPTSFGKSVIVDSLIQSGRYGNIAVVVPTIALLDETRRRLSRFSGFKVVTHPNQELAERNILVLTQERLLAMPKLPAIDLFFIDEFYKLADQRDGALEARASILNQAFLRLARTGAQFYLAGPVVEGLVASLPENLRASFIRTDFSTVSADTIRLQASNDDQRLTITADLIGDGCDPTLVYCQSPAKTRKVLEHLIAAREAGTGSGAGMPEAARWIEQNYHPDWVVAKALRRGIGVHHGRLPRWLAQKMVEGFEAGDLDVLVCTNSLIEGVNTRAKRIIILDRKIATRAYNYFTFANIRGRAGRMLRHFVGEIYLFHDEPGRELPEIDIPGVSQSDIAPSSLLVQIDEDAWTEETRTRLEPIIENSGLDLATLRQVKGVEPEAVSALAQHLRGMPTSRLHALQWSTPYPDWDDRAFVCQLIWDFIPPPYATGHGAFSAVQLAFRLNRASAADGRMKDIISEFVTDDSPTKDLDERIESAFDFVRFWLDHNFPACLRALDVVAREVLTERGLHPGSFEPYAARVEAIFSHPHLSTIEEYGLPMEITRKLVPHLQGADDLDGVLTALGGLDTQRLAVTPYERRLLNDFARSL